MSDVKVDYLPVAEIDEPLIEAASIAPLTPSQAILDDVNYTVIVKDKLGRSLSVKRVDNALVRFRMARILGNEGLEGSSLGQAMIVCAVVGINEAKYAIPDSMLKLEARIQLVRSEGMTAVVKAQRDHFGVGQDEEADKEELKN